MAYRVVWTLLIMLLAVASPRQVFGRRSASNGRGALHHGDPRNASTLLRRITRNVEEESEELTSRHFPVSDPADGVHLGCFEDNADRVWKHGVNTIHNNSPQQCKNMCTGYKFYGLEYQTQCLCGNNIPPKEISQAHCNYTCPRLPGITCGGDYAMDVYRPHTIPAQLSDVRLGCYRDSADRVWKHGENNLEKNSPQLCKNLCRGFKFYGLEGERWCFCGDDMPLNKIDDNNCISRCPGVLGKHCGGIWALDVYQAATPNPSCDLL